MNNRQLSSISGKLYDREETINAVVNIALDAGEYRRGDIQRKLSLGYARMADIEATLEKLDILGPYRGGGPRIIKIDAGAWLAMMADLKSASRKSRLKGIKISDGAYDLKDGSYRYRHTDFSAKAAAALIVSLFTDKAPAAGEEIIDGIIAAHIAGNGICDSNIETFDILKPAAKLINSEGRYEMSFSGGAWRIASAKASDKAALEP